MSTNEETEGGGDCKVPQEYDPSDCPEPDAEEPISAEETDNILRSMGMTPCSQGSLKVSVGPMGMGGGGKANFSIGCEQATLIAKQYRTLSKQIQCIVSKSTICDSVNITGKNIINIINRGTISCPMDLTQKISIKLVQTSEMSTEQTTQVIQKTEDFVEKFLESFQDSETGGAVNPQGQKFVDASMEDIQSIQYMNSLTESVNNSFTEVFGENQVNITNEGQWTCKEGEKITLYQDIAIDAVINKIFKSAMENAYEQKSFKEFIDYLTSLQESKQDEAVAGGWGGVNWVWIAIFVIGVIIVGWTVFKSNRENMVRNGVIVAIIYIIVVFFALWGLGKISSNLNPLSEYLP